MLQQTESEFTAQAAFVAVAYKSALLRNFQHTAQGPTVASYGITLPDVNSLKQELWRPQSTRLDLAIDDILPPPPVPEMTTTLIPAQVQQAGEEITRIMKDAQQTTLAAIRVVDINALIVATTGEDLHQSLANWQEVSRALGGEFYSLLRQRVSDQPPPALTSISRGTLVRVFQATPVIHQGHILGAVILSHTPTNIGQSFYKHRTELMIAGLILIGLVLAISTIELLQDHAQDMPETDRNRFLANLNKDADYLNTPVQQLLELARADTIQSDRSISSILPIIIKVAEGFKRMGLVVEISGHNSQVMNNEEILQSILANLFDNAHLHGGDHIAVSLTENYAENRYSIKIADNGPGVTPANKETIF